MLDRINGSLKKSSGEAARGRTLLAPRSASQKKYYEFLEDFAGVSEHTRKLGDFVKTEVKDLKGDSLSFTSTEVHEMVSWISALLSAALWTDLVLSSMGAFIPELHKDKVKLFQDLGISCNRAVNFRADHAATIWAN